MIAYTVHIGEPKESKPLREIAKAFFVALPRLFRIPGSTPKNKRAVRLALICARVGTQGQIKKRGFSPAFVLFLTLCIWFGVRQNRQPQAPLPVSFQEANIAELPQAMLGRPVKVIAKVFAALPGFEVGCQQQFMIRLTVKLIKCRSVASYI